MSLNSMYHLSIYHSAASILQLDKPVIVAHILFGRSLVVLTRVSEWYLKPFFNATRTRMRARMQCAVNMPIAVRRGEKMYTFSKSFAPLVEGLRFDLRIW